MTALTLSGGGIGKWLKGLMFPGIAGVMLAITLGFIEMLKQDGNAGTDLLKSWGPGFLLGLLAIVIIASFLDKMVDSQQSSVDAQQRVAVALTQLAERDNRDRDRMATEMQYIMQRMEQIHSATTRMESRINQIHPSTKA